MPELDKDAVISRQAAQLETQAAEIAARDADLENAVRERDEVRSLLASCTDLANQWAREHYTAEAKNESGLHALINRLWVAMVSEVGVERDKARAAMKEKP